MTLLEQARKALPGVVWREYPHGMSGWVNGRQLDVWSTDREWYCQHDGNLHATESAEEAFAVLRRWLTAERDALNAALGEGWRPATEPPDESEVVLFTDGQTVYMGGIFGGEWLADTGPSVTATHWRSLPEPPKGTPG